MDTSSSRIRLRKSNIPINRKSIVAISAVKNQPACSVPRNNSMRRRSRISHISTKLDLSTRILSPSNELQVSWTSLPDVSVQSKWGSNFVARLEGLYFFGGGRSSLQYMDYASGEITEKSAPSKRVGHSLVQYRDSIITYGGLVKKYNQKSLSKKLHIFSITTQTWSSFKGFGQLPEPRAFHAATQIGRHFVMFGGITRSYIADDLALLDLVTLSWVCPELNGPPRLSHASLTAVVHPYVKNNIKASMLTLAETKCYYAFQNSGLYLFGGIDVKKQPSNKVYRLTGSNGVLTWEIIKTKGIPPCPRYSHSAAATGELLVVFGGKSDDCALSDLHVLNVMNWKWAKVLETGLSPSPRWNHCLQDYGSKILVFGGMDSNTFTDSRVYVLEVHLQLIEKVRRNTLNRTRILENNNEDL